MKAPRTGYEVNLDASKRSGRFHSRYKTKCVYDAGECESRLEIRVAWSLPSLSKVPLQIT
jgi:hypothetical protein